MADNKVDVKDVKGIEISPVMTKAAKEKLVAVNKDLAGIPDTDVILVAKDGKEIAVNRRYAALSTLVYSALEGDLKVEKINVPQVSGATLASIVAFMNQHKGVEAKVPEKPLRSKVMADLIEKWDADFIDGVGKSVADLYALILAANFMDIKSLLAISTAKVAALIKGQPLEKIKATLDPNTKVAAPAAGDQKDEKHAPK